MVNFDFRSCRVAVLGDMILDRYIEGGVERVSPEAPVAVLSDIHERRVAGGAANVVANLAALGARARPVGVIGADAAGQTLAGLLGAMAGVDTAGLVADAARPTTSKTRVMSGRQQMVRIDDESRAGVDGPIADAIIAAVRDAVAWADVLVISDYAKGVCTGDVLRAAIDAAAEAGKPTVVDPKRRDLGAYRGATLLTPNRRELREATGMPAGTDDEAEAAAARVIDEVGCAVLVKRSERGMSHFAAGEAPVHLRTAAREVFDVSGAGDTVSAVVALGLAQGRAMPEVMRLANLAAGVVVGKVGTAAITIGELKAEVAAEDRLSEHGGPLVSRAEAVRRREEWRSRGLEVGFTNGCFDLLHPGHVSLLARAADACDRLIVALNSDASVRRLKGEGRPVQSESARAFVMGALAAVDLVVLFDEDTPEALIHALKPDVLVKGADYTEQQVVGAEFVKSYGGQVLLAPIVAGQSTTSMIQRASSEGAEG